MLRGSRRWWLLSLAALGALAAGCLSPTLPLPPPSPPDVEKVGEGQYSLRGTIPLQGDVIIKNTRTGLGYLKSDVTVYEILVAAAPGDRMQLWYESGPDKSDAVEFRIEPELPEPDAGADTGTD